MLPMPIPEIKRTNLASTCLQLKAMGIENLLDFDFLDPPSIDAMLTALTQLYQLSAFDADGKLTRLGKRVKLDCLVARLLSIDSVPFRWQSSHSNLRWRSSSSCRWTWAARMMCYQSCR